MKTCPDCNAPVGEDMYALTECWWPGQIRERLRRDGWSEDKIADWLSQGADRPCEGNAYDVRQRERSRRNSRWLLWPLIGFVIAGGLIVYFH